MLDLPPPPDGTPAGPNLEADADDQIFGEMERAARGRPESQFGSTIEAAQPPDWNETASLALQILARSRDLRVMVLLAMARINQADLPGFAAVLATIRHHIETMWDHIHPQLDPEDEPPNDPMLRVNCVAPLEEVARVLRPLRELPLARLPKGRPIAWRDVAVLDGQLEPEPGRPKLAEAEIRATFARTNPAALASLAQAADDSLAELAGIIAALSAHGPDSPPDLKGLVRLLRDVKATIGRFPANLAEDEPDSGEAPGPDTSPDRAPDGAPDGAPDRAPAPRASRAVSIRSLAALHDREDALAALDLASAYFRDHEPSSPVPLLIDRARRLAGMPFLDILRDLAPDGLQQAQTITGTTGE